MSVAITWYDKVRDIVLYTLDDDWTLQAIIEAKKAFEAPLSHQPGYFIVDMRDITSVPDGLLAEYRQIFKHFNTPNVFCVIVSNNRMLRWMLNMWQRMGLKGEFHFTNSMQAALTIIDEHQEQKAG
jgi:hypothetical protein